MATNSSNTTIEAEVGWQAAPLTRGTASILWNCTFVVLLVTWTNFHPPVGAGRKQRILTAITATCFPALPALVAAKDFASAYVLWRALRSKFMPDSWRKGWTLTQSFLVVKGGIRLRPYHRGRDHGHSDLTQNDNIITEGIVEPQTFEVLAYVGSIQYEDFPTLKDIHDRSKADWIAKTITLLQLLWMIVNIGCRNHYHCLVSLLERLILEWVVPGLLALFLWWKCPQNIEVPFYVSFRDHRELMTTSDSDDYSQVSRESLHEKLVKQSRELKDVHVFAGSSTVFGALLSLILVRNFAFHPYQFHSSQTERAWSAFTTTYTILSIVMVLADWWVRFAKTLKPIEETFEELLLLDSPESNVQGFEWWTKWHTLAVGMGIYNPRELDQEIGLLEYKGISPLRVAVVAVFVALFSQFARLVIALSAFSSAPRGIYDVPQTWVLESLAHIGG